MSWAGLSNKLGRARSKNLTLLEIFKQKPNVNVLSVARWGTSQLPSKLDCLRHELSPHLSKQSVFHLGMDCAALVLPLGATSTNHHIQSPPHPDPPRPYCCRHMTLLRSSCHPPHSMPSHCIITAAPPCPAPPPLPLVLHLYLALLLPAAGSSCLAAGTFGLRCHCPSSSETRCRAWAGAGPSLACSWRCGSFCMARYV